MDNWENLRNRKRMLFLCFSFLSHSSVLWNNISFERKMDFQHFIWSTLVENLNIHSTQNFHNVASCDRKVTCTRGKCLKRRGFLWALYKHFHGKSSTLKTKNILYFQSPEMVIIYEIRNSPAIQREFQIETSTTFLISGNLPET